MRKSVYLLSVMFLFIVSALLAPASAFNPKPIDYMDVEITESGTLAPAGEMREMTLTLYLPLNYTDLEVQAQSYNLIQDALGNSLIELKWTNVASVTNYQVKTHVRNHAIHLTDASLTVSDEAEPIYLRQGDGVEFTDMIKKTAFPYKHTLEKIAELVEWTNNYIEYNSSYVGKTLNTADILAGKKGVCVEYSTLLTSLLRAAGMPTRYATGYAYSDVDKTFIGHTWIEVLMQNNEWLPVDPTWMEVGYLDATHIKTANLLENKQTETLRYLTRVPGTDIKWTKNPSSFNIIDTKEMPVHELQADVLQRKFAPEETGYILGTVSADECSLISLRAVSCVDSRREPMLNILNPEQVLWMCNGSREVYWFFNSTGNNYVCPITIFDQENSVSSIDVQISGSKEPGHAIITGPATAAIDETFNLTASIDSGFFFYSTKYGKEPRQTITHAIDRPGSYQFYLYSDGMLETKTVNVVEEKEFDISVSAPQNVTVNKEFQITLHIANINHNASLAQLTIEMEGRKLKDVISVERGHVVDLSYNITATEVGLQRLTASVYDKSVSSYTTDVNVVKENASFLGAILDFFASIFTAVANFFGSLF